MSHYASGLARDEQGGDIYARVGSASDTGEPVSRINSVFLFTMVSTRVSLIRARVGGCSALNGNYSVPACSPPGSRYPDLIRTIARLTRREARPHVLSTAQVLTNR